MTIHTDATMHAGLFEGDERAELALDPARLAHVHVARGSAHVNGPPQAGDGARLEREQRLVLDHCRDADVIVFDLAR